jgi:acyl-CoA reductase-like NAD-dependent aldehyde dehydrogenase
MEVNEAAIRALVEQVVRSLHGGQAAGGAEAAGGQAGVFGDIESAVRSARKAHEELMGRTLETRRRMIAAMREAGLAHLEEISRLAAEETGMGRAEDKVLKNRVAITATPGVEDLVPLSYTDDHGLTLVERAPYGVVGSITPSTNPTETILNNAIGMVLEIGRASCRERVYRLV